jgi:type II secretory pathway component GspD/PulD (secretin)
VLAQQQEIQAIFERAERNYNQIRAGNQQVQVKNEAAAKWREIVGARRRIIRCTTAEQEKIARFVNRLEELVRPYTSHKERANGHSC